MEEKRKSQNELVRVIRGYADMFELGLTPHILGEITTQIGNPGFPLKIIHLPFYEEGSYMMELRKKYITIDDYTRILVEEIDTLKKHSMYEERRYLLVLPPGFFGDRAIWNIYTLLLGMKFVYPCQRNIGLELRLAYIDAQPYGENLAVIHSPIGCGHNRFFTVKSTSGGERSLGATMSNCLSKRMSPVVSFLPC